MGFFKVHDGIYLVHDKFHPKKSDAVCASSVETFERLFWTTLP